MCGGALPRPSAHPPRGTGAQRGTAPYTREHYSERLRTTCGVVFLRPYLSWLDEIDAEDTAARKERVRGLIGEIFKKNT